LDPIQIILTTAACIGGLILLSLVAWGITATVAIKIARKNLGAL
jgi:hypothetical protein